MKKKRDTYSTYCFLRFIPGNNWESFALFGEKSLEDAGKIPKKTHDIAKKDEVSKTRQYFDKASENKQLNSRGDIKTFRL